MGDKTYTVHYNGPTHSGQVKGDKVGGPYKDKNRARNAVDKKDNAYGAYVHQIKEHDMTIHGEGKPYNSNKA